MKITVCDICEKRLDEWELSSVIGEDRFRVVVQKYRGTASTGNSCWKVVECCSSCMVDLVRKVAESGRKPPQIVMEQAKPSTNK